MKPIISIAELDALSSPLLDKFRVDIRSIRTSELILFAAHPKMLADYLGLREFSARTFTDLFSALTLTVIDEIDRRIPIPEIP